ncbi:hypothetical protein QQ045_015364 [Rhodiola kirilowii]
MALRRGMEMAAERSMSKVVFVSDNIEVIQSFFSNSYAGKDGNWFHKCIELFESNAGWRVEHALRGANRVADFLAQQARDGNWDWSHESAIPIAISVVIKQDSE